MARLVEITITDDEGRLVARNVLKDGWHHKSLLLEGYKVSVRSKETPDVSREEIEWLKKGENSIRQQIRPIDNYNRNTKIIGLVAIAVSIVALVIRLLLD